MSNLFTEIIGDMAIKDLSPKDANSSGRIIKNMRICGSGLYEYNVREAPLMGIVIPEDYHGDTFKVYRPAEVLKKNKDLYARVPIITGHHVRVNTSNAKQLAVGMVGDTVLDEVDKNDGETYLYTTGTIITGDGIEAYEKYGELSVGYDPIMEWAPGTYKGQAYQAILKGFNEINHLLICQTARGGHQCMVMDSIDSTVDDNTRLQQFVLEHETGGTDMGIFKKIFASKPMTGDSAVVSALLQSIAVGANPKVQVSKVREIAGDAMDETFKEYLGELELAGDESPEVIAKAVNIVDAYYKEHCVNGDEKVIEVKKDGDKKNVEVKEDGKETKDIEVKKDGDKKDVTVKEPEEGDAKACGDSIDYDKLATMVADKLRPSMGDAITSPEINGDSSTTDSTVGSDEILKNMF